MSSDKRRILFIRPTMGKGGADRVTWQLLQHYDRERYDVSLAVMRAEGPFMKDLPGDVEVVNFNVRSLDKMLLPLWRHLRQQQYDYLYSTSGGTNIVAGLVKRLPGSMPSVVLSERNILFPSYKSRGKHFLFKVLKNIAYREAEWVTAVSEGIVAELRAELGVPQHKLRVVHNPLIDQRLHDQQAVPLEDSRVAPNGERTVLAVGRMVRQKDYPTLIEAFALLEDEVRAAVQLVILGDGPLADKLVRIVDEKGLSNQVLFLGYQNNPYKYMSNTDVFVLSSLHEGLPGVLVQAMACGAACVSTDCPTGPNELIDDGRNGYLVPVGDAVQLSRRIAALLNDGAQRAAFAAAAPEAVRRYHTDRAIASYFNFLA